MKTGKKLLLLFLGLFLLLGACSVYMLSKKMPEYFFLTRADRALLKNSDYGCLMLTDDKYSIPDETIIPLFFDKDTLKITYPGDDLSKVDACLSAAFYASDSLDWIYFALDPHTISEKSDAYLYQKLFHYIAEKPQVTFDFLLPAPSLDYYLSLSPQEAVSEIDLYEDCVQKLCAYPNVNIFYSGSANWLIQNPGNYSNPQTPSAEILQKLFALSLAGEGKLDPAKSGDVFAQLRSTLKKAKPVKETYPDFSGKAILFFGDSIIAKDTDSTSIPGILKGLTNASTRSYSKSGLPASKLPDSNEYFLTYVDEFLQTSFDSASIYFVINLGLNDYFCGQRIAQEADPTDVTTYTGALRTGIRKLQTAYPDAKIIVMAPTYTVELNHGTEKINENSGILTDYVNAAVKVADEENVYCLNNFVELGVNSKNTGVYQVDGTHFNETGRFLLSEHLIQFIESIE
ncbi:MAG: SGNH/GDSL hydrolase family protein [Acetatifactor sp.]|nr:SGNH/GDSL hydrolase family protein [Acetatifactor sp.]